MIGWVCGPIGSSMPSLIASLPARPTPTIRPSLIPMSALTAPMTGSSTSAPAMTTSSSDGLGRPCASRGRIVFA
jgi:hypothetical protein